MKLGDNGLRGIAEMAPPANYTEIRRFLGATGFNLLAFHQELHPDSETAQ